MYKVKEDIISGFNVKENKPNLLFKKGDLVDGNIEEKFVFNKWNKGIVSKITVPSGYTESDGEFFILLSDLEKIPDSEIKESKSPTNKNNNSKNILLFSLILGGVAVGIYFILKK